ncbi:von Ebner gland protein 1-like isoform X2 [Heterocephalus glaber]|uniref:von Ebner gland protein 1-like isoform X2 n=1 Tax=Heterocephalus glaber TaxID=10181 RepID=A0AAX6T900_HETGA|nr:von Ebner gland protein 1-like isoform X2 [Heterocephalus glaber]
MKTLILTFGLGLLAALRAQDLPGVEEENQEVSGTGTWYLKAVASDKKILGKNESVSVTPIMVKSLEGGSVELKFTVLVGGQCHEISVILEKTDEPGKYTAYEGKQVVHIITTGVQDHYTLYSESKWDSHVIRTVTLMGRDPEVNQEALEEFEKVVEARGLKTDSISIPKQRGRKGTALPDPGSLRTGQAQLAPGLLAGAGEMLADRGSRGPVEFPGPQPWFSLFSRSLLSRKRLGPESRALKRPWRPHRSPPATHTGQPRRLPPRAPLPFRNKQLQPLPDSSFLSVGSGAPQGDF